MWKSQPVEKNFKEIFEEEDKNSLKIPIEVMDKNIDSKFHESVDFSQYELEDYPIGYQEVSIAGF